MEMALSTTEDDVVRGAEAVEQLCDRAGFGAARRDEVRTAVVEALSNAMIHGNRYDRARPILLRAVARTSELSVEIEDTGPGVTRLPPEPDLARKLAGRETPGGWGIHLMRSLASVVEFEVRPEGRHTVRLRFGARAPRHPVDAVIRRGGPEE
jgi:anti-sigma regulatory factor (Ser/Thr protein kinase)